MLVWPSPLLGLWLLESLVLELEESVLPLEEPLLGLVLDALGLEPLELLGLESPVLLGLESPVLGTSLPPLPVPTVAGDWWLEWELATGWLWER